MNRIFLIGYMGAGKTTLGTLLAEELGVDFVDLDLFIEARYQKTIGQIFEEDGEDGFRKIESAVLKEVGTFEGIVISVGGGTPCFYDNMEFMNEAGRTIYLKTSSKVLADRLNTCKSKRPLIKDKSEEELLDFVAQSLKTREPFYLKSAHVFETETLLSDADARNYVHRLIKETSLK